MDVTALVERAHQCSKNHGFWDGMDPMDPKIAMVKLALVTSEIGEAVEAIRNSDEANLAEELADIVIRVADLAGAREIDLDSTLYMKMGKNEGRPYQHGRKVGV